MVRSLSVSWHGVWSDLMILFRYEAVFTSNIVGAMENMICKNDFKILDRPTHEIHSRRNATNGHRFAYNAPLPHQRALS
jgi:hypothetical protein